MIAEDRMAPAARFELARLGSVALSNVVEDDEVDAETLLGLVDSAAATERRLERDDETADARRTLRFGAISESERDTESRVEAWLWFRPVWVFLTAVALLDLGAGAGTTAIVAESVSAGDAVS